MNIENESNTVMPSDILSPLPGGSQKTNVKLLYRKSNALKKFFVLIT